MWVVHRLIKTQIRHARDFTWYRSQLPSAACVILSHERVQIHVRENLCSYATNPPHFRLRELLLCDILITRAGDGRWPRYQAKSVACPGCGVVPIETVQNENCDCPHEGLHMLHAHICSLIKIRSYGGMGCIGLGCIIHVCEKKEGKKPFV